MKSVNLIAAATLALTIPLAIVAGEPKKETVNVDSFIRAETAFQFDRTLQLSGGVNKWVHLRQPTPLDKQSVIRMNRDTLYSAAIVDISKGATLTMPEVGERYMSLMIINEDHYVNKVLHAPGSYKLTMEAFDTPYVSITARTLVDASDPEDVKKVNALQDGLKIDAAAAKPYAHPDYDKERYQTTYDALLVLGRGVPDAKRTFGKKEDVDPVRHLLATAWGWGGLPEHEAFYLNVEPNLPVGAYRIDVKDVPVRAFWSVTVYNADGYIAHNELGHYSFNSVTSKKNRDGSVTIHFGSCDDGRVNCIPITKGWNYTVRLYEPEKQILDGSWTFPALVPAK